MKTKFLSQPEYYLNRELSWLEFNHRVLQEGCSSSVPLLERLKFLSIACSNLDEFFMVRAASLRQQQSAKVRKRDPSGMTPAEQLGQISIRVHQMASDLAQAARSVLSDLEKEGIRILRRRQWTTADAQFLRDYFQREVLATLTPVAVSHSRSLPLLPGLQWHVLAAVQPEEKTARTFSMVIVPLPTVLPRFVSLPGAPVSLVPLEDVLTAHLDRILPRQKITAISLFRITRDADVSIQDDEATDLLDVVEQTILDRRRRSPVRLELSPDTAPALRQWLLKTLRMPPDDLYETDSFLDASSLMELSQQPGFDRLKDPPWPPQPSRDLLGAEDLWQEIQNHDILLFHPYERFDPVVQLLQLAAEDPGVLAIKQTLYRTSGDSPIIKALQTAAENGKQVTVLVELKARFDEARNVQWARKLEDSGCLVLYGIAGYKTHSKALLIVRREKDRIRRYVHLATGNYNDKTARLYTDLGMMTCSGSTASDVATFFNLLTGYSDVVGWSDLAIAPTDLRRRFLELIEREAHCSTPQQPGLIMAKLNSLQDPDIIRHLYMASQAGVKILLNIRGICCLRPGVKKISQTIEVHSIIDRYLEHSRIFYFQNAGHDELYLSSADWMTRNLDQRFEILFPVKDPNLRRRLLHILHTCFADNTKAWILLPDGRYQKIPTEGPAIRSQETFYQEAVDAVRRWEKSRIRFRPLKRPGV